MDLNDLGRLIMVVIENSYNLKLLKWSKMKNIKKINLAEVSDKQGSVDDTCSSGGMCRRSFGSKYKALC